MPFTKADLALSTMWNFRRARSGEELLDQLSELGFGRVELNYQVRPEWLPGIESYVQAGRMKVSSVHNVFPKTFDERFSTDSVMLGYEDESLRRQAIELAKISIEWACRLGAGAVVFHPTEVPMAPADFDVPLKKLIAAHQTETEEFRQLQARMFAARQAAPYLSRMMKSIEELADHVTRHRLPVKLGMENRAMCHQIPIYPEMDMIAERFDGGPVGLWLDTGHGIMMQEMGLQALPLSPVAERNIVGMHIHDAADGLDHYAPCTLPGHVLAPFRAYILASPIKVLELSGRLSAEEILRGTDAFVQEYGA
ncbi:MAG: TIM barrel protein [Christensenellaceae bacterium]|nr:TIM barrel protein [Christensenellaceae bacterium]